MKEVTPKEAYALMQGDPEYIYLDVRSVPEFEGGHAPSALNIPLLHFAPETGMTPNQDFVAVVEANLPKDAKLVIGCKSGGRSAKACEIMSQIGYSNVANIRGGFVGAVDNLGRMTEPGWSAVNLPACTDCGDETRYGTLAKNAQKA